MQTADYSQKTQSVNAQYYENNIFLFVVFFVLFFSLSDSQNLKLVHASTILFRKKYIYFLFCRHSLMELHGGAVTIAWVLLLSLLEHYNLLGDCPIS